MNEISYIYHSKEYLKNIFGGFKQCFNKFFGFKQCFNKIFCLKVLKWEFLELNDALTRFLVLKWCLSEIYMLKRYSNKIKSLRFIYSHSAPVISFIFDPNRENLAWSVHDLNGTV